MGSKVSVKNKRLTKKEYNELLNSIDKDYFIDFYLNNCNEAVCVKFNIGLGVLGRLLKDFEFKISKEQFKEKVKKSTEQRCIAKYGVGCPFAAEEIKDSIKKSNLEKYGVENVFQLESVKDKIKQTCLDRYGVEHASQVDEVKEKSRNTCLEKYGVDNYAKTTECREKTIETLIAKYGRTDVGQYGSIEYKTNMLKKYGVEYPAQSDAIINKIIKTNQERYGVDWFSQTIEHQQQLKSRYSFNGIIFDSLPELAVYKFCIDMNISIKRSDKKFEYTYENKLHYYFPDFEIDGRLVEIKGDHFFNSDGTMCNPFDHSQDGLYEAKHQCMLQNNVEIWSHSKYKEELAYFLANYDEKEFKIT